MSTMSCISPNKLWRSDSIFNLWVHLVILSVQHATLHSTLEQGSEGDYGTSKCKMMSPLAFALFSNVFSSKKMTRLNVHGSVLNLRVSFSSIIL